MVRRIREVLRLEAECGVFRVNDAAWADEGSVQEIARIQLHARLGRMDLYHAAGAGLSGGGVSSGGKGAGSLGASTTLGGGASAGASLNSWQPLSVAASKHEASAVRRDTGRSYA